MKSLLSIIVLISIIGISFIQNGISSDDPDRGRKLLEELESLSSGEYHKSFQNLREEDKKLYIEAVRSRNTERKKTLEKEQKRRFEISVQGSAQLEFQILYYFRAAGETASKSIEDSLARGQFEKQMDKELLTLRKRINENGDISNMTIWKKYKPLMESVAKEYPWKSVDRAALTQIEAKLIQPLIKDLEESARQNTP